jgi:hypothetical protein
MRGSNARPHEMKVVIFAVVVAAKLRNFPANRHQMDGLVGCQLIFGFRQTILRNQTNEQS